MRSTSILKKTKALEKRGRDSLTEAASGPGGVAQDEDTAAPNPKNAKLDDISSSSSMTASTMSAGGERGPQTRYTRRSTRASGASTKRQEDSAQEDEERVPDAEGGAAQQQQYDDDAAATSAEILEINICEEEQVEVEEPELDDIPVHDSECQGEGVNEQDAMERGDREAGADDARDGDDVDMVEEPSTGSAYQGESHYTPEEEQEDGDDDVLFDYGDLHAEDDLEQEATNDYRSKSTQGNGATPSDVMEVGDTLEDERTDATESDTPHQLKTESKLSSGVLSDDRISPITGAASSKETMSSSAGGSGSKAALYMGVTETEVDDLLSSDEQEALATGPILFEMIDFSSSDDPLHTDIKTEASQRRAEDVSEDEAVKSETRSDEEEEEEEGSSESRGFKGAVSVGSNKQQTNERHDAAAASGKGLDGSIMFPSKAFLQSGGTAFISLNSELQREVALLAGRLNPSMHAIAREVATKESGPECPLQSILERMLRGEKVAHLVAKGSSTYTPDEVELFHRLAGRRENLHEDDDGIYLNKRRLLFSRVHCHLFQAFSTRFVFKSTKPIVQMLKEEFLLTAKTYSHTKCGCLSNPLIKFTQVEQNIPLSLLPAWYRDRASFSSPHGRTTHRLALLGRGRRPTKIVVVVDRVVYSRVNVGYLFPSSDAILSTNMDFVSVEQAIRVHPSHKLDSVLYLVMANVGALLSLLPPTTSTPRMASSSSTPADESLDSGRETEGDLLLNELPEHVVLGALRLWQSVLCSTRDSDVLFVPVPEPRCWDPVKLRGRHVAAATPGAAVQTCSQHHDGPSCPSVLKAVTVGYNAWVAQQHAATGRKHPFSHLVSGGTTAAGEVLPSPTQVTEQVVALVNRVKEDITSYKDNDRPARLRVPEVRAFGSGLLLVVEERFAGCLAAYCHHIPQVEVFTVPQLSVECASAVIGRWRPHSLLALVPSWLSSQAVTADQLHSAHYTVFTRTAGQRHAALGVEDDGRKVMDELESLVSALRGSCPIQSAVVTLPCLPLHLVLGSIATLNLNRHDYCASQLLLLEDEEEEEEDYEQLVLSYTDFNAAVIDLAANSFAKEGLHCDAMARFEEELERSGQPLCTRSRALPEPALDLYGQYGRLLYDVAFTAKCGFPCSQLSAIEDVPFTPTYPTLTNTAHLVSKWPRYSHVVLVGSTGLNSELSSHYSQVASVSLLPSIQFTNETMTEFLDTVSCFPPNTLFMFLLDVTMLSKLERYPDCATKGCSDSIIRYSLENLMDNGVELVSKKVQEIFQQLINLKKCLPNQSSVIMSPLPPHRLLLQEEEKSYFNHSFLHSTFYCPGARNPIAYGSGRDWTYLYDCCVTELKKPGYVLDVGLENLVASIDMPLEPVLSHVNNPRLYSEEPFPQRDDWCSFMKELVERAQKLVFPVAGISKKDELLAASITSTASSSSTSSSRSTAQIETELRSLVNRSAVCQLDPPLEEDLCRPCDLVVGGGRASLPLSFVNLLGHFFNASETAQPAPPRGWLVRVPDMVRAALMVAILHGFRCTLVTISVECVETNVSLPPTPPVERERLRAAVGAVLRQFAFSCDKLFMNSLNNDEALLSVRESDYVEGLDASFCYLLRELQYLHQHRQQDIKDGLVLLVVVTATPEAASSMVQLLQTSLSNSDWFSTADGSTAPTVVSKDTANSTGHVLVGTPRFVLALMRTVEQQQLRSLQLLLVEELKMLIHTGNKIPLLDLLGLAATARQGSSNGVLRTVVVSCNADTEELAGANVLLSRTLRLVRRTSAGAAFLSEYDAEKLPKVVIRMDSKTATPPAYLPSAPKPTPKLAGPAGKAISSLVSVPVVASVAKPVGAGPVPYGGGVRQPQPTAQLQYRPTAPQPTWRSTQHYRQQQQQRQQQSLQKQQYQMQQQQYQQQQQQYRSAMPSRPPMSASAGGHMTSARPPMPFGPRVRLPPSGYPMMTGFAPRAMPGNVLPPQRPPTGPPLRPAGHFQMPPASHRPPAPSGYGPPAGPTAGYQQPAANSGYNQGYQPPVAPASSGYNQGYQHPVAPANSGYNQGYQPAVGPAAAPAPSGVPRVPGSAVLSAGAQAPPPPPLSGSDLYDPFHDSPDTDNGPTSSFSSGAGVNKRPRSTSSHHDDTQSPSSDRTAKYRREDSRTSDSQQHYDRVAANDIRSSSKSRSDLSARRPPASDQYAQQGQSRDANVIKSLVSGRPGSSAADQGYDGGQSHSAARDAGRSWQNSGGKQPRTQPSVPYSSEQQRAAVEAEHRVYYTAPERHPHYKEHRADFMRRYQQQYGRSGSEKHCEQEWNRAWIVFVEQQIETQLEQQLHHSTAAGYGAPPPPAPAAAGGGSGNGYGPAAAGTGYRYAAGGGSYGSAAVGFSAYGSAAAPSKTGSYGNSAGGSTGYGSAGAGGSYGTSEAGPNANSNYKQNDSYYSSGRGSTGGGGGAGSYPPTLGSSNSTGAGTRGATSGAAGSSFASDLDPASLAQKTIGLSSVELAVLIKRLVAEHNMPDSGTAYKKLFMEVSALHMEYATQRIDDPSW